MTQERGITDLVGDAFDLVTRGPWLLLGAFAAFDLCVSAATYAGSLFQVRAIEALRDSDADSLADVVNALLPLIPPAFAVGFGLAALLCLIYAFVCGVAQYSVRELIAGKKPELAAAMVYARENYTRVTSALVWFSFVYLVPFVIGGLAITLLVKVDAAPFAFVVGFVLLIVLFAAQPVFRLVVAVPPLTGESPRQAYSSAMAFAKARWGDCIAIAFIFLLASLVMAVVSTMLTAMVPSGSADVDWSKLSAFSVRGLLDLLLAAEKATPLWTRIYLPIASAVCTAVNEGFCFALVTVWFARRTNRL